MKIKSKPVTVNRATASMIANALFQNGMGQHADRLVLTSRDEKYFGGWCKGAVIDQIEHILEKVYGKHLDQHHP